MITSTQNDYLIEVSTNITFISMILVLFLTIFSLIKKHPLAKYIFIAWIINIIGLFSLAFNQFGIINFIDYYPYFYEITVFLEAIIFSVVLASKLNKTKELEQSVKTNEVLTRELHHRVKNNMQFIILMYRLKLANLTTPKIDQKLNEIEGLIQAMSKTHEILYNQENLSDIDTKLYFTNLIEEMKRSFDTSKIKISLDISTTIDTQTSIYCGIILNELMTNCFKYAFENKQGQIDISLEKSKNKYIFSIKDSGIGFDYDKKKDESFGLSFVHEMVRNELKGKIEVQSQKGTNIRIEFKC
jgi:two-component sensor histidine kinase